LESPVSTTLLLFQNQFFLTGGEKEQLSFIKENILDIEIDQTETSFISKVKFGRTELTD